MPATQRAGKGGKDAAEETPPVAGAGRSVQAALPAQTGSGPREVDVGDIPKYLPAVFRDIRADASYFATRILVLGPVFYLGYCFLTGWTPMHLSVHYSHLGPLRWLLALGLSPEAKYPPNGRTPLHLAALGNLEAMRILISAGADKDAQDSMGAAPLMLAISKMDEEAVKMLLDAGADPNAKDKNSVNPLHIAAVNKAPALVQLLLEAGADIKARDVSGKTPWDLSSKKGKMMRRLEWVAEAPDAKQDEL